VPHPAVGQLLPELVAGVLDALARGLDVVHADARVAEAAMRFVVAVVGLVGGIVLGAVVVREFDHALAIGDAAALGHGARSVVCQEV